MKNQNELIKRYSEFFEYLKDYQGPMMPIQFGFECGDGWYVILDELMGSIKSHIKNVNSNRKYEMKWKIGKRLQRFSFRYGFRYKLLGKLAKWAFMKMPRGVDKMPPIHITQIKEKFGGLRFYYDGGDDYIDGMISLTESLSYRICETCGSTKNVGQTQGWITTICEECIKEEDKHNWKKNKD